MITLLPGQTDFLATMYSFGAMLSFTIAHVSVIQLRRRKSEDERPWKPPLNFRAFGFEVPLTAVLGGLGTFAAWIVVMALNPTHARRRPRLDGRSGSSSTSSTAATRGCR